MMSTTGRNSLLNQTNFPKKRQDDSLFLIGSIKATKPKAQQSNFSENQYGLQNASAKSLNPAESFQGSLNIEVNVQQKIKRTDSNYMLTNSNLIPGSNSAAFVKTSKSSGIKKKDFTDSSLVSETYIKPVQQTRQKTISTKQHSRLHIKIADAQD